MKRQKIWTLGIVSAIAAGLSIAAYAGDWELYYSTHYDSAPSPYEFTNVRGCTWNYTTSYGGTWGVQHLYTASGSCPYSEQKVNYTSGGIYNNTSVYHR